MRTYTPFMEEGLKRGFGYQDIIISVIFVAIAYIPLIFYILTIRKNLTLIDFKNRSMEPNFVWFTLIPLFNIVWNFFIVTAVRDSNHKEFLTRNIQYNGDFGYNIGLAYCILSCLFIIPCINFFTAIAGFVCWIIYWIRVSELTRLIIISSFDKS
ncbi:MAG: hypothetical protein JXB50_16350 [Spirochaetes bacterium]|nr:hypothetical protein [Spirochaetota bacterium]